MYTGYYQKFQVCDDKLNNGVASWMVNLKNQTIWIKNFAYSKYLGKRLNIICSSIFEKHGNTYIGVKYPYSEWSPPLKTGVNLTIFKSSGNISFSSDQSNINFKEAYSSPKHSLTTLKLI